MALGSKRPPTRDERDSNLDSLASAVKEWGDEETKRLENETQFLRKVLKGRGAEGAATENLITAENWLVDEISAFVSFGRDDERG